MNTMSMSGGRVVRVGLLVLWALCSLTPALGQGVPVRLSFKFILNASGNRPATGDINTDAEVNAQVGRGNRMLAGYISELRFQTVEIVDVAGISQWYPAEPTEANLDDLRAAARNDPATYLWRTDAINIYISGSAGTTASGRSQFPPDNDIIMLPQGIWDNTVAHEIGHSLNLRHTHETCCGGDECGDTIEDSADWSRDDIARNSYGAPYDQLTADEQYSVDLVWFNVMSYHNGDEAFMLSACQRNRISRQCYTDRDWLLGIRPVYVDSSYGGILQFGTFDFPYLTIQQAIEAGLTDRALVLKQGRFGHPSSAISTPTLVLTRGSPSSVQCKPKPYSLPQALEHSDSPGVREGVVRAQQSDRQGDLAEVIAHLEEAEQQARGPERSALQIELAQRLRDLSRPQAAALWFQKAAAETDQEELRKHALKRADAMAQESQRGGAGKETTARKPTGR
jgi:hypothetical protein